MLETRVASSLRSYFVPLQATGRNDEQGYILLLCVVKLSDVVSESFYYISESIKMN